MPSCSSSRYGFWSIESDFKSSNFRPAYHPLNTVSKLFSELKGLISKIYKREVYKNDCGNCSSAYIGETGQQLNIRVNGTSNKNGPKKSASAEHLLTGVLSFGGNY